MPIVNAKKKLEVQGTADGKERSSANTFNGKVVSITGDKLVMTNNAGKEHTHTLAKDAKITGDGKACKPEDLKAGCEIRITTKKDDRNVVTSLESLNKNNEFAQCCG